MKVPLYTIFPQVVPVNESVAVCFKANLPGADLRLVPGKLRIESVGGDGLFTDGRLPGHTCGNGFDMKRPAYEELTDADFDTATGVLTLRHTFLSVGEHNLRLCAGDDELAVFTLYAVPEEWAGLRPFRGDLHLHTGYSGCCGDKVRCSPEFYTAECCARGLDFIGVSDHKQRQPSLKAAAFAEKCGGNFKAYPCEEVHLPDLHNLHILNFGGSECVSDVLRNKEAAYQQALAEYLAKTPADADHFVRSLMANSEFIHRFIGEHGGLSVFCHPYWKPANRYFMPQSVLEYVMDNCLFDALEIFGAPEEREGNDIAAAMHTAYCIRQHRYIPVVGNNDAHSTGTLAINSSVVLARRNELKDIIDGIRSGMSVAVSDFAGEFPRCAGQLEMVKFFHFLRRNYYPYHDIIAAEEGRVMLQTLTGAAPDEAYAQAVKLPYPQRKDQPVPPPPLAIEPDGEAFAALKARRKAFEDKFFLY